MLLCDAKFHKCGILQCIFHLNHSVNSKFILIYNEFCCTSYFAYSWLWNIWLNIFVLFLINTTINYWFSTEVPAEPQTFLLHLNVGNFSAYRNKGRWDLRRYYFFSGQKTNLIRLKVKNRNQCKTFFRFLLFSTGSIRLFHFHAHLINKPFDCKIKDLKPH